MMERGQENWCQRRVSPDCKVRFTLRSVNHFQCDECRKVVTQKNKQRRALDHYYANKPEVLRKKQRRLAIRDMKLKATRLRKRSKGPFRLDLELRYNEVDTHRFFDCACYESCMMKAAKLRWTGFSCYCCKEWVQVEEAV
jgi:hypothetical protein